MNTELPPEIHQPKSPHNVAQDPLRDSISSVELIRISGSDVDIANAARVSYGKRIDQLSERDKELIYFLLEHNHTSPFEHNQLSFRIKCPMFVARQWMRHRMNSYNEISYRYAKAPEEFYIPDQWRKQDIHNKQSSCEPFQDDSIKATYQYSIDTAMQTYRSLLAQGVCRELARGVLPACIYTQFIFTCNLHSLMHFLKLRLHAGAQWEIRQYALALVACASPYFPVALSAWKKLHIKTLDITEEIPDLETALDL